LVARRLVAPLVVLVTAHALVVAAPLLAPYDPTEQHRAFPYAPPARLHLVDDSGHWQLRPFVYEVRERPGEPGIYTEDRGRVHPLRLLPRRAERVPGGPPFARRRLFGVDPPGHLFLLGTDAYGRDQLSRLLYGGRLSLGAGLGAALIALGLGFCIGVVSGFRGGWTDAVLMRTSEVFLAVPWLYLLLAVRAALPLHVDPAAAFLTVIGVVGLVDWPRTARLVRGVALSVREQAFVLAARGFGASELDIIRIHVAPHAASVALTQAAIIIPQYVMAEVALSFLGLGVAEPAPSWGSMLASLQEYRVLTTCWWMCAPALVLVPIFVAYFALAESLQRGTARTGSVL
jgi:peptide/nickel transport system permease protein